MRGRLKDFLLAIYTAEGVADCLADIVMEEGQQGEEHLRSFIEAHSGLDQEAVDEIVRLWKEEREQGRGTAASDGR